MATFESSQKKLRELEERLTSIEASEKVGQLSDEQKVTKALDEYKIQLASRLREISAAMAAEKKNASVSGDAKVLISERDDALALVQKQQIEIDRLKYRVNHLVKALTAEEERNKQ